MATQLQTSHKAAPARILFAVWGFVRARCSPREGATAAGRCNPKRKQSTNNSNTTNTATEQQQRASFRACRDPREGGRETTGIAGRSADLDPRYEVARDLTLWKGSRAGRWTRAIGLPGLWGPAIRPTKGGREGQGSWAGLVRWTCWAPAMKTSWLATKGESDGTGIAGRFGDVYP